MTSLAYKCHDIERAATNFQVKFGRPAQGLRSAIYASHIPGRPHFSIQLVDKICRHNRYLRTVVN
jgi:hypothetical protein